MSVTDRVAMNVETTTIFQASLYNPRWASSSWTPGSWIQLSYTCTFSYFDIQAVEIKNKTTSYFFHLRSSVITDCESSIGRLLRSKTGQPLVPPSWLPPRHHTIHSLPMLHLYACCLLPELWPSYFHATPCSDLSRSFHIWVMTPLL